MSQDYRKFDVGSRVAMSIAPENIQVMRKERTANHIPGEVTGEGNVELFGSEFEADTSGLEPGTSVDAEVAFDAVELLDDKADGTLTGEVSFILYKGDHYHLTVTVDKKAGHRLWVDTHDVWDKCDMVGVRIAAENIKLTRRIETEALP